MEQPPLPIPHRIVRLVKPSLVMVLLAYFAAPRMIARKETFWKGKVADGL